MTRQDKKVLQTIGDNLRFYRKRAGLSQIYVHHALHVSQNTISNYERGQRSVNVVRLAQLAKLYNCTMNELTEGV